MVSTILTYLSGKKTYLTLALGAGVVLANHFGYLPSGSVGLDPNNWLTDLYALLVTGTFRSAITKIPAKK